MAVVSDADQDKVKRQKLNDTLAAMEPVEELSGTSWLLKCRGEACDNNQAVVTIEMLRPTFRLEEPKDLLALLHKALSGDIEAAWMGNDRFHKQTVPGACDVCIEVIYPASSKDVAKRRTVMKQRVVETSALYDSVTIPQFISGAAAKDVWVANIIQGKAEQEDVVHDLTRDGIVVVKDYKWQNVVNSSELYYLCLFSDLSIRSLRDLRSSHVPLLRRVRDEVVPALAVKHGVLPVSLLAYVHYHPTFWYFHIHIVNSQHPLFVGDDSCGMALEGMCRFHDLDTMLALLEASPDHYATASLPILLRPEQAPLYAAKS